MKSFLRHLWLAFVMLCSNLVVYAEAYGSVEAAPTFRPPHQSLARSASALERVQEKRDAALKANLSEREVAIRAFAESAIYYSYLAEVDLEEVLNFSVDFRAMVLESRSGWALTGLALMGADGCSAESRAAFFTELVTQHSAFFDRALRRVPKQYWLKVRPELDSIISWDTLGQKKERSVLKKLQQKPSSSKRLKSLLRDILRQERSSSSTSI